MQTFLCLVDLFCAVIANAPARHIERWLTTLIENVAALSAAHPLLSGFYKIARVALVAADDAGVFEESFRDDETLDDDEESASDRSAARETCHAFLLDVLAGAERLSDELRAAALQLLLAAPAGLLAARELAPALRDALAVGAHHPPLARAALDVLDRWTGTRSALTASSDARETTCRETTRWRDDASSPRPRGDPGSASVDGAFASRVRGPAERLREDGRGRRRRRVRRRGRVEPSERRRRVPLRATRRRDRARRRSLGGARARHRRARRARARRGGRSGARTRRRRRPARVRLVRIVLLLFFVVFVDDALGFRATRLAGRGRRRERARHHLAGPDAPARRALRAVLHGPSREGGGCRIPARRDAADGGAQRPRVRARGGRPRAGSHAVPQDIPSVVPGGAGAGHRPGARVQAALLRARHAARAVVHQEPGARSCRDGGAAGRRRGGPRRRPRATRRGDGWRCVHRRNERESLGRRRRAPPRPVRLARGRVPEVERAFRALR